MELWEILNPGSCKHPSGYFYSAGVDCAAEAGDLYWLIDTIFYIIQQRKILRRFGIWKLEVGKKHTATLSCEDFDYNLVYKKKLKLLDFPLDKIEFRFQGCLLTLPNEN